MWKNNRPEGWDKDRIITDKWWDEHDGLDSVGLVDEAVEAGADAMLEGLKKQGKYNTSGYGTTDFPSARKGWFIFIPD